MTALRFWAAAPFRLVGRAAKFFLGFLLIASLCFNAAVFTVSGLYAAVSGALSTVGVATVAAREAGERIARRKTTKEIGRQTARKVTRRVQKGAVRNVSSVAGEAVPFLGVAVIAGALSLEIKDACETAADMTGLEAALEAEGDPEEARARAVENFNCTEMIREQLPDYENLPSKEDIWSAVVSAPKDAYNKAIDAGIKASEYDWAEMHAGIWVFAKTVLSDAASWAGEAGDQSADAISEVYRDFLDLLPSTGQNP